MWAYCAPQHLRVNLPNYISLSRIVMIPALIWVLSSSRFTSVNGEKEILAAYNLHVNCFVTKPVDLDQFIGVVKSIEHFWFSIVKLPAA